MNDVFVVATHGCDASTYALLELSPEQHQAVQLAADAINERSHTQCEPTLSLKPLVDLGDWDRDRLLGDEHEPVQLNDEPPMRLLALYTHLHVDGKCRKNRWGVCDAW